MRRALPRDIEIGAPLFFRNDGNYYRVKVADIIRDDPWRAFKDQNGLSHGLYGLYVDHISQIQYWLRQDFRFGWVMELCPYYFINKYLQGIKILDEYIEYFIDVRDMSNKTTYNIPKTRNELYKIYK